jgi:hypothetical protein
MKGRKRKTGQNVMNEGFTKKVVERRATQIHVSVYETKGLQDAPIYSQMIQPLQKALKRRALLQLERFGNA